MEDLLKDLGSSKDFAQHIPSFNSWQGIISDEEDDEFTDWAHKNPPSMKLPKLVSWASERSIYDLQSKRALSRNEIPISGSRYISALDLGYQRGKIPSKHHLPPNKTKFNRRINAQDGNLPKGNKLNFLQAVKGNRKKGVIGSSSRLSDGIKVQHELPKPMAESGESQSELVKDTEMRSDIEAIRLSISSDMSLISNYDSQERPSLSNHASQERANISSSDSQERATLSNRTWQERSPVSNRAHRENVKSMTHPLYSNSQTAKSAIQAVVSSKKTVNSSKPHHPSVISGSLNTHQECNDMMAISPPSPKGFSSPKNHNCFREQSSEVMHDNSNYPSEWLIDSGIPHDKAEPLNEKKFHIFRKEMKELMKKNIMLKREMDSMRERHLIVEQKLRHENLCMLRQLRELTQMEWKRNSERGSRMETAKPRGWMQGVSPGRFFANALQKDYRCQTFSLASMSHPILNSKSTVNTSEMSMSKATKVNFPSIKRISAPTTSQSATELGAVPTDDPNVVKNVTLKVLNKPSEGKKLHKNEKVKPVKKPSTKKREPYSLNVVSSPTNFKPNAKTVVDKTSSRKGSKKDKDKKGIKSPVFDFTNLIVNYLPPEMDSSLLQKIFAPYGDIVSCKVVMDHKTNLSKGYGFVKFKTKEQATAAVEKLDQYHIGGKVLKVACARKTERGKPENKQTNLYIANLDKNVETSDIRRVFSKCGYVVQCRVLKDVRGITRRIGFVRFDSNESALRAIKQYDGKKMEGTKSVIQVRFANVPKPPPTCAKVTPMQVSPSGQHPALFIPELMSHDNLSMIPFSPNSQTGFDEHFPGEFVAPLLNRQNLPISHESVGQNTFGIEVSRSDDAGVGAKPTNLSAACYVSGINATTEEAELKKKFDPEGLNKIKSVRIIRRRAGPYAFVNFFQIEDALEAVKTLNQTQMGAHTLTVRLR